MRRFNWACPTCGAATHSKEALVRSSEKSCSCDSALWVASDMPPCVGKLQEEIAALREHLTSHIKQIGGLERIINMQAARVAALEKVAKLVLFYGTGHMEIRVALREAGYLGGEGD